MAAKPQVNIRLSAAGRKILAELVKDASRESLALSGRRTTMTEIIETAIRQLAESRKPETAAN